MWDECGGDVLQAVAEEQGKSPTVSREEAMEVALDAGRCEQLMGRDIRRGKLSQELFERWEQLDYEERCKLVRPAFPYTRYGY